MFNNKTMHCKLKTGIYTKQIHRFQCVHEICDQWDLAILKKILKFKTIKELFYRQTQCSLETEN